MSGARNGRGPRWARRGRSSEHAPPDLGLGGELGGQGRARRRGSEVSCAGVVAGGGLDEAAAWMRPGQLPDAEQVRQQPWRKKKAPPLCPCAAWLSDPS